MHTYVEFNEQVVTASEARISVLDRGFLLGDAVYEIIPLYQGVLFRLEDHIRRLNQSLAGIRLNYQRSLQSWHDAIHHLIQLNEAQNGNHAIYIQVTRGEAPQRSHHFPEVIHPNVLIMMWPVNLPSMETLYQGFTAIKVPDIRWSWCYIKATTLLPNLLMNQQARDHEAQEAILIRDGEALEGATSNLFIVHNGVIITPPKGLHLLGGITRDVIIELAEAYGLAYRTASIPEYQLDQAEEIWITSSTKEIYPIVKIDDQAVGHGEPGPIWHKMLNLYQAYKDQYINNKGP